MTAKKPRAKPRSLVDKSAIKRANGRLNAFVLSLGARGFEMCDGPPRAYTLTNLPYQTMASVSDTALGAAADLEAKVAKALAPFPTNDSAIIFWRIRPNVEGSQHRGKVEYRARCRIQVEATDPVTDAVLALGDDLKPFRRAITGETQRLDAMADEAARRQTLGGTSGRLAQPLPFAITQAMFDEPKAPPRVAWARALEFERLPTRCALSETALAEACARTGANLGDVRVYASSAEGVMARRLQAVHSFELVVFPEALAHWRFGWAVAAHGRLIGSEGAG